MHASSPGQRARLALVLSLLIGGLLVGCAEKKLGPMDYPPGMTPGGPEGPGGGKATKAPGGTKGGPPGPGMR